MSIMKYGNEGMDLKKLLLLLANRVWVVILAAVIGAAFGGGIYMLYHVAISNNREYQAQSKVYLDFAPDETGEVYQHYNGYTWNDLMSTDLILDTTMGGLPDDYTREEVIGATSAEILSDVRLLTITITTSSMERTDKILEATNKSLVEMGQREKEFIDIEVIKATEAKLLAADMRLLQAVLVGCVTALVLVFIALEFVYILDDRIYVSGDLRCVTKLPFVGYEFENIERTDKRERELAAKLQKDAERNKMYLAKEPEEGQLEQEGGFGVLATLIIEKDKVITEQEFENMRKAKGVLLAIPYKKIDRSSLAYRIEQLEVRKCKPAGIIIKDADMRFIKWYYNYF